MSRKWFAFWPCRQCVARAVSVEGTLRCELLKNHAGNHATERGMYWVAWSQGTWTEGDEVQDGARKPTGTLAEAIAGSLSESEVYFCTRVWEAWSYDTMTADDFVLAAEEPDIVDSLVAAVTAYIEGKV